MQLRLGRNAAWALAEVLCSAVTLFLLYRIVVKQLGVESLGIWSLVLATTAFGRLADIGTAAGLSRFVAMARAKGNAHRAMDFVQTAFITNFVLYLAIALLMWAPAWYALGLATSGSALIRARELLPYSLVSFVLIGLASTTTGGIVGQQHSDQKSMIAIASLLVQFFVAVIFVPRFGLIALAWAQVGQYALVITSGWCLFLKNEGRPMARLPVGWHAGTFRELIGFGMKLQAASIISLFYDPVTKFIMSSFGGLEALGLFEMAQRMVQQARQLVVLPTQILVPGFAHLKELEPERVEPLYHQATAAVILIGLPLMTAVALCSPIICYLWIGHADMLFVTFTVILCAGWGANLIAAPAYLLGVASGYTRGIIYGNLVSTISTTLLGISLGKIFGAAGVVTGAMTATACGSLLSGIMNCNLLGVRSYPAIVDFKVIMHKALVLRKQAL